MKKAVAISIMILFISVSVNPSTGNILSLDDTTPPVTTHSLDPPEPDGENGYYVNDVEVTLNATDNESGVDYIKYRIEGGSWIIISSDNGTFLFDDDGNDVLIEYRAYDKVGNEEEIKSFTLGMDQTSPKIDYSDSLIFWIEGTYYVRFTSHVVEETSGMDRVDMFIKDTFYKRIEISGPFFNFTFEWSEEFRYFLSWLNFYYYDKAGNCIWYYDLLDEYNDTKVSLFGLILNPVIYEDNVTFFALLVREKDYEDFYSRVIRTYIFKRLTYPNNYQGKIGKYFINADFWYIPDD